jgi:hypothetical protein
MNYKVKQRFIIDDDIRITRFLEKNLPYPFSRDFFNWQYNRDGAIFYYIEEEAEKEVVGVNGLIPYVLTSENGSCKTAKSETSYLSSNHQGQGLFKKLYHDLMIKSKQEGFDFVWGFTKLGKLWSKLGFNVAEGYLFETTIVVNPTYRAQKIKFSNENKIKSCLRFFLNKYKQIYLKLFLSFFVEKNKISVKSDFFDYNKLKIFYQKLKEKNPQLLFFELNKHEVEEVLLKNPKLKYHFLTFYEGYKMIGYLIYTEKNLSINITDIQFIENFHLEKILISFFKKLNDNIYDISYFGNYQNEKSVLIFNFFKKLNSSNSFSEMKIVYKINSEKINSTLLNLNNWYINSLWTESIHR